MLDDAAFPIEALHEHPERLTSLLGPRTPRARAAALSPALCTFTVGHGCLLVP
jgi:hypothetical protein